MGGYGSGNWRKKRKATSDFPSIDIRQLQRAGYLVPGHSHTTQLIHKTHTESLTTKTTSENTLVITYHHGNNKANSVIHKFKFEQIPCNYGGKRAFFLCPICGRRKALLYCVDHFACRQCHDLTYTCQGERPEARYVRQANKIRERLSWKTGVLNPSGRKPKGMHKETFSRLTFKQAQYASKVLNSMCKTLNIVI